MNLLVCVRELIDDETTATQLHTIYSTYYHSIPDSMYRKDSSSIMKTQLVLYETPTMVE